MNCERCGTCCKNNGLIPPLLPGDESPEWLQCLVNRLRTEFGATSEEYPCVFLTDDMRCAIYELERPRVCCEFSCNDKGTELMKAKSTIQKQIRRLERITKDAAVSVGLNNQCFEAYHALRWVIEDTDWTPAGLAERAAEVEKAEEPTA